MGCLATSALTVQAIRDWANSECLANLEKHVCPWHQLVCDDVGGGPVQSAAETWNHLLRPRLNDFDRFTNEIPLSEYPEAAVSERLPDYLDDTSIGRRITPPVAGVRFALVVDCSETVRE